MTPKTPQINEGFRAWQWVMNPSHTCRFFPPKADKYPLKANLKAIKKVFKNYL